MRDNQTSGMPSGVFIPDALTSRRSASERRHCITVWTVQTHTY